MVTGIFAGLFIIGAVLPADAQTTQRGAVRVSSIPEGADIYLNDEDLGLQTNSLIENVFPGIHYVRLEKDGYRTYEEIFEVREGLTTSIDVVLDPVVGGEFTVRTTPSGARIFIDGSYYGTSDTVLSEISTGQHRVLLTLDGYADYAVTVTVYEDMPLTVMHTFEEAPATGTITVSSVPSGAEVYLQGGFVGTTRKTIEDVVPGTYMVLIQKAGYEEWQGTVDVAAGKISEISAELTPAPVILEVRSEPVGATVSVDGKAAGNTLLTLSVTRGSHTISVEKFGYEPVNEEVDIGVEGASLFYVLVSKAPEAIAEAERAVAENSVYSPKRAEEELARAKDLYASGDAGGAITAAESAILLARDVDRDGVENPLDISPNMHNMVIYASPIVLIVLLAAVVMRDMLLHRVRPEISIEIPETIREDDMLARAVVTADAPGGTYRGFVCTVLLDGVPIDHHTAPGRYDVMLSGRQTGVHRLFVHLQVAKTRYGTVEKKAEETFIVEPPETVATTSDEEREGIIIPEEGVETIELFEDESEGENR